MKFRKLTAGLLATTMSLSLITVPAVVQAEEEPYEIVMELIGSGIPQTDVDEVLAAINEITVPAINCTVKFREIPIADHATQINLLGTDGERLDIIFVGYTTSMQNLVANGLLVGLGDLLEEYAPETLENAGRLMDACYVGDDYYCVPGSYYPGTRHCIAYSEELFNQYGIEIPENPEDSVEYMNKIFDNIKASDYPGYCMTNGDGASTTIPGYDFEKFGSAMFADGLYGVLMDMKNDTEIVDIYETDAYRSYMKQLREWQQDGTMIPDSLTSGDTLVGAMMAQKVCMMNAIVNCTFVPGTQKITGMAMTEIPTSEATITGTSVPEYGLGVTVTSEHPEKAVQLLNLIMTNPDLANLMNYGIEGKHYVKVSDHIIDYPEGVNAANIGYGAQIVSFGDCSKIYQRTPFTEEWYDTLPAYGVDEAAFSQAFGYVFNAEPVRTQVAAVSSVIQQYNPMLMCGMVEDVDGTVDAFVSALKAAGIDEIIAENQRQFDEWRASK